MLMPTSRATTASFTSRSSTVSMCSHTKPIGATTTDAAPAAFASRRATAMSGPSQASGPYDALLLWNTSRQRWCSSASRYEAQLQASCRLVGDAVRHRAHEAWMVEADAELVDHGR